MFEIFRYLVVKNLIIFREFRSWRSRIFDYFIEKSRSLFIEKSRSNIENSAIEKLDKFIEISEGSQFLDKHIEFLDFFFTSVAITKLGTTLGNTLARDRNAREEMHSRQAQRGAQGREGGYERPAYRDFFFFFPRTLLIGAHYIRKKENLGGSGKPSDSHYGQCPK